jgi:hypothetical protein
VHIKNEEHRLGVSENRVVSGVGTLGTKREITEAAEHFIMRSFIICNPHPILLQSSNQAG